MADRPGEHRDIEYNGPSCLKSQAIVLPPNPLSSLGPR
jgi:hypothetical protein